MTDYGRVINDLNKIMQISNFKMYSDFNMALHRHLREKNIPQVFYRIEGNYPIIPIKPPPFEVFKKYWDLVETLFVHPSDR